MSKFRILSLDGGGIRGVYSARILQKIQKEFKIDLYKDFDLIAGTSTGAIIASSIAVNIDIDKTILLYKNEGAKIFKKSMIPSKIKMLYGSLYNPKYLEEQLKDIFKNKKLCEIEKPLLISATDIGNSNVFVFKTVHPKKNLVRDKDILLSDAVLASASAPIFFPPHKVGNFLLSDGGLWCNNPSLVAFSEAVHSFGRKPEDIRVLSIGTGVEKIKYNIKDNMSKWGFLTNWKGKKLISTILNLQTVSHNNLINFLHRDKILRLSYQSDKELPLDDVSQINNLLSSADEDFTYNFEDIEKFIKNNILEESK